MLLGSSLLSSKGMNGPAGSNIKNIQRGKTRFLTETAIDVTISAVNPSNSIILFTIVDLGNPINTVGKKLVRGKITSATNINFNRGAAGGTYGFDVYWQVIEFTNIKSIQKGDFISDNTGSQTVTISAVNVSKAFALISAYTTNDTETTLTSTLARIYQSIELTDTTTITLIKTSSDITYYHWQVIEFN